MTAHGNSTSGEKDPRTAPGKDGKSALSIALIGPDDDRRKAFLSVISGRSGAEVREFSSFPPDLDEVPRAVGEIYDVVILDVMLPKMPTDRRIRVLDLGVGSGALLLAMLGERPNAVGLGVDASEEALAVARENAANLGLAGRAALLRGDWTTGLAAESFDIVVSNPPYIASGDIAGLAPEVRDHEPRLALDGGPDGLTAYRRLAPEIMGVLVPGGLFAVEVGLGQATAVRDLFAQAGAAALSIHRDLSDRDRIVAGEKPL